jgi:hypothetical protein
VFLDDKGLTVEREYLESISQIRSRSALSPGEFAGILEDLGAASRNAPGPEQDASAVPPAAMPPPAMPPEAMPAPSPDRAKMNIALSLTSAGLGSMPVYDLPLIEEVIGDEQRERFIRTIFKKDEAYYSSILMSLNRTNTWQEASSFLDRLIEVNGLDPSSTEVVEFTGTIRGRYNSTHGSSE